MTQQTPTSSELDDARRKYEEAARRHGKGDFDGAAGLTREAAAAGYPPALFTLGTQHLETAGTREALGRGIDLLTKGSAAGNLASARQLAGAAAMGLTGKPDWLAAVTHLCAAARGGYPPALRELAVLARFAGAQDGQCDALLALAAERGDWIAAYLALRRGGVFGGEKARIMLDRLKAMNAPLLDRLSIGDASVPPAKFDISSLHKKIEALDLSSRVIGLTTLNAEPFIASGPKAFSNEVCDYLICTSAPRLVRSRVVNSDAGAGQHAQFRTSDEASFGLLDIDLVVFCVYSALAQIDGGDAQNCELLGVLRYLPGQEYLPHHDFLPPDADDYSGVKKSGQRVATALLFLNDNFDGGETAFPRLGLSHRGGAGDVLFFRNTDETENPYPDTLHAGRPVTSGEKWIVTLWRRAKPFWFWV